MIYLASPYSDPDPRICEERFVQAAQAAAWLIMRGNRVLSPICHSHSIAVYGGLKGSWEAWAGLDTELLQMCDSIIVLILPGWEKSEGLQWEVGYMQDVGRSVRFLKWPEAIFVNG